ncbi:MAG: hypothetical protein JNM90_14140 [Burkholderiales bacterium]|nr:hypothetical protein [Burkholderiales bacterium]
MRTFARGAPPPRPRRPAVRRCTFLLAFCCSLLAAPHAAAQFIATWIGGSGAWLAKTPGDWAIASFNSLWQYFPDNTFGEYFFTVVPSGHVHLDIDLIPGENGVPLSILGVSVSTLSLSGGAQLSLHNQAALSIQGISLAGGVLTNDGQITLNGSSALDFPLIMPINGSGRIVMASESSFLGGLAGVLTHSSAHTISGFGTVSVASLINQGTLIADTPGKALRFTGLALDNSGVLRAGGASPGAPGGELRLQPLASFDNSGTIVAENGMVKLDGGSLGNSGLIEARNQGLVSVQGVALDNGGGTLRVRAGGALVTGGDTTITGGQLEAEAGSFIAVGSGQTELRGSLSLTGMLRLDGGTLRFAGAQLSMPQGEVHLAAGMTATAAGTSNTFRGGVWSGAGVLAVVAPSVWDASGGVSFAAGLTVDLFRASHRVAGTFTNDAAIRLRNNSGFNQALQLVLDADTRLAGSGTLRFAESNGPNEIVSAVGARLENGPQHALLAQAGSTGTVVADLWNDGLIDAAGGTLNLWSARIDNAGIIRAGGGGTILFNRPFGAAVIDNHLGRIESLPGALLQFSGTTNTVIGGTLAGGGTLLNIGTLILDGASQGAVTIEAGARLTTSNAPVTLSGTLVNQGVLNLHDGTPWLSGPARLQIAGPVRIDGSGRIELTGYDEIRVEAANAQGVLEIGSAQTLTTAAGASGALTLPLSNQGRVEARGAGSVLQALTTSIVNTGVLAAADGATLAIGVGNTNTLVDNSQGRIEALAGSFVTLSHSHPSTTGVVTIRGGVLGGAGRFDAHRLAALDGAAAGALTIEAGTTVRVANQLNLYLAGSIVNHGTLELADGTPWLSGNATLWINGAATLGGAGRTRFASGDETLIDRTSSDALLTVGPQHTLGTASGASGTIRANLAVDGRVEARGAGSTLQLRVATIANRGVLAAADGSDLRVGRGNADTTIDNTRGRIVAETGSRVFLADASHPANFGVTTVQGGRLTGTGTIFMQLAQLTGGVTIAPGNSPGILAFNGNLHLDPAGALEVDIGGTVAGTGHDRVTVSGSVLLAGQLVPLLWGGYVPGPGDSYTILTAQAVSGGFGNLVGGRVFFAGGSFGVTVTSSSVTLGQFVAAPVPEPQAWALLAAGLVLVRLAHARHAQRRRARGAA